MANIRLNTEKAVFTKYFFDVNAKITQSVLNDLALVYRDMPLRMGTFSSDLSPVYRELLLSIRVWLLQSTHTEKKTLSVQVPSTWLDHLKDDMLKSDKGWQVWLAGLMTPPQYTTVTKEFDTVIRVCPHNNSYVSEDATHIEWLLWRNDGDL